MRVLSRRVCVRVLCRKGEQEEGEVVEPYNMAPQQTLNLFVLLEVAVENIDRASKGLEMFSVDVDDGVRELLQGRQFGSVEEPGGFV